MQAEIFGIKIAIGQREELIAHARSLIGKGGKIATVNPIMMSYALENEEFRDALSVFDLCIPDGVGIKAALLLRREHTDTLAGVELGAELVGRGAVTLGLIGGEPGVARGAMDNLIAENPELSEAFVFDGYSSCEEEICEALKSARADLVYVCLGTPKQEMLISRLAAISPATVFVGLGGSLDIYSGRKRRAPRIFRLLGAEWLWRMIKEPRRIKGLFRILTFMRAALTRG